MFDIAPRKFRKFLPSLNNKIVIVGGGGLIGANYFTSKIEAIMNSNTKKIIFWGVGHNIHGKKKIELPDYLKYADLVGIRDYGLKYQWVPCPSCLHPAFNKNYKTKHKIVIYENTHFEKLPITGYPSNLLYQGSPLVSVALRSTVIFTGSTEFTTSAHPPA